MASKQLVFQNVVRDLTTGQFFDVILIDGGGSYTMYIRDLPQPPTQPANVAQITTVGATPVIAPSGGGDVVGLGTTGTVMLWADGPNSVAGDSVLTQVAGSLVQPTGNYTLTLGNLVLGAGTITFPDNVRQTFNPGAAAAGVNVGAVAVDPSTPVNGDLWYDSALGLLRARVAGANVSIGTGTITVGTTMIGGGVAGRVLYETAGNLLGEISGATSNGTNMTFGSGNLLATSPVFTTDTTVGGGVKFSSNLAGTGTGFFSVATNQLNVFSNSVDVLEFGAGVVGTGYVRLANAGSIQWLSGTNPSAGSGGLDTSINRISAGVVGVGVGGAPDFTGSLKLTNLTAVGLTANAFLFSGTGSLLTSTAAPTNGQLLIGSTGVAPVRGSLASADGTIIITVGAGTIDLGTIGTVTFLISQSATPLNLTAANSQATYTNEGAAALIVVNLPTAAAGLTFEFIVQDADGFQITAGAGDTIRLGASVSSVAGTASSTTIGSTLRLIAINATEWIATSIVGTWATA